MSHLKKGITAGQKIIASSQTYRRVIRKHRGGVGKGLKWQALYAGLLDNLTQGEIFLQISIL
jgi:hypothetical protein